MAGLCISEILGSICGGLLFHSLGYLGVMILQSALLFVSCPLLVYFFCLRDRPIVKNKNEDIAEGREVSFSTLIKNPVKQINGRLLCLEFSIKQSQSSSMNHLTRCSHSNFLEYLASIMPRWVLSFFNMSL